MKIIIYLIAILAIAGWAAGQSMGVKNDPQTVIRQVLARQRQLQRVSYFIRRSDTLVTGDTRAMSGNVYLEPDEADTVFGFKFQARKDGFPEEMVYDGHSGYLANDAAKSYAVFSRPSQVARLLYQAAGQLVCTDLLQLDTANAVRIRLSERNGLLYLLFEYPDLVAYDVIRRSKMITINASTMLPVSVRHHQETLGKVQDLFYEAADVHINEQASPYNFSAPPFLTNFVHQVPVPGKMLAGLQGTQAPIFQLTSFTEDKISLSKLAGSVVLLDFWEVWCGPCIQSMPRVEALYQRFHAKGLQVFGIINDLKQLESARRYVDKHQTAFPMLIGNPSLVKNYQLGAIPLYVLIDRTGKIVFVSEGYSEKLEVLIGTLVESNG